ncbi:hypothetical protein LA080_014341 [Diaporthe eres]|uniref:SET domain-containing protein n=1 Tax=Diaporthe vaccinii TaxID=105482 RepID=A0ABR4F1S2_9PEZI|nr:hypothetical protein LA080_014341 [Diaporthe eres]
MIGLTDSSVRPLFQYYDPATDSLQDVTYPDGSQPRRIDNYILDPADWQPKNRTYRSKRSSSPATGPPLGTKTRAAVLVHGVDDEEPCLICGREGTRCFGDSCVRSFRRRMEGVVRAGKLRIERADGTGAALGCRPYGVFAGVGIRRGGIVGEYLGRLHPPDRSRRLEGGSLYAFELEGVTTVDAREYGSITRFVNHRCQPNLDVRFITYGRRRCIAFAAGRDINPGEQVFIHYGDDYFRESKPCLCDVVSYPHVPPKGSEPPWRVRIEAEQAKSQLNE